MSKTNRSCLCPPLVDSTICSLLCIWFMFLNSVPLPLGLWKIVVSCVVSSWLSCMDLSGSRSCIPSLGWMPITVLPKFSYLESVGFKYPSLCGRGVLLRCGSLNRCVSSVWLGPWLNVRSALLMKMSSYRRRPSAEVQTHVHPACTRLSVKWQRWTWTRHVMCCSWTTVASHYEYLHWHECQKESARYCR